MMVFLRILTGLTVMLLSGVVMAKWSIPLTEWMFSYEVTATMSALQGYGLVLGNLLAMLWAGALAFAVWAVILFAVDLTID